MPATGSESSRRLCGDEVIRFIPLRRRSSMQLRVRLLPAVLAALACAGPQGPRVPPAGAPRPAPAPAVTEAPRTIGQANLVTQVSGTTQRLQAVSVVNERIVWASGTGGTFVLTTTG